MYGYESAIDKLAEWYFEMNTSDLYELERYRRYYYKYNGGLETLMLASKNLTAKFIMMRSPRQQRAIIGKSR